MQGRPTGAESAAFSCIILAAFTQWDGCPVAVWLAGALSVMADEELAVAVESTSTAREVKRCGSFTSTRYLRLSAERSRIPLSPAAVSKVLTAAGISANVVAGFTHDRILSPMSTPIVH